MMIDYTGQQIGSYRLVRRLGSGGFASVYEGQHVRIATQQAAIKLLHLFDVDTKKFQKATPLTSNTNTPTNLSRPYVSSCPHSHHPWSRSSCVH